MTKKINKIIDKGDYSEIIVIKKDGRVLKFKIDKIDTKKASKLSWYSDVAGYATHKTRDYYIRLHQLILGNKKGLVIDHINRNKQDNRRKNLRHCTQQKNSRNSKNIFKKGVYWCQARKKWIAQITLDYRTINLGGYKSKSEAYKVRKIAVEKYY